jgi:hypothetical protein
LILNGTVRVYPCRLPQKHAISPKQVQKRGNAATLAKNRPVAPAAIDRVVSCEASMYLIPA